MTVGSPTQSLATELAVVIPTRQRWPILARTLEALAAQSVSGFETIVVVDGTDQRVPTWLRERPGTRVLEQPHGGPGTARNKAVSHTDRRLILFLGDDMIPAPTLIAQHLAHHNAESAPEVAVLGRVAWHPEVARSRLLRWLDWSASQFDFRALEGRAGEDVGFGRFYSCNVSLKRELFTQADGFDSDFRFDYEDLDLGWRLHERGLRLIYEPAALAFHLHSYDWKSIERRYVSRAGAERLMCSKHSWFSPWFHNRIAAYARQPTASRIWPLVVDYIPARARPLRRRVEARANRWYHQQLAPGFLAAWERAVQSESEPRRP